MEKKEFGLVRVFSQEISFMLQLSLFPSLGRGSLSVEHHPICVCQETYSIVTFCLVNPASQVCCLHLPLWSG